MATQNTSSDSQPGFLARKTSRSRKAPSLKTAVIVKRSQGQDKTSISKDLGIARNTVTRILEENDVTRDIEANQRVSLGLIPRAIQVAHDRLTKGSENMAIKVLENTIWPLNQKQGKGLGADVQLNLAIQNLIQPQSQENKAVEVSKPAQEELPALTAPHEIIKESS